MTEENKAESIPEHSHDEMYLVSQHMAGNGPDYESCHHCGFIKVPEIDRLNANLISKSEALEYIKAQSIKEFRALQRADAENTLLKYQNQRMREALEKIASEFPEHGMSPRPGKFLMGHPDEIVECDAQRIAKEALKEVKE